MSSSKLPNLTPNLIKIRVNPTTSQNITVRYLCGWHFEDLGTSKTAKNYHFREWRDHVTCSRLQEELRKVKEEDDIDDPEGVKRHGRKDKIDKLVVNPLEEENTALKK